MTQASLNNLEQIIISKIQQAGSMPLGEFISLAMTHLEYGYYTSANPIGARGDFTTAPEISQIFGELVGAWIVDLWLQMGSPEFNLVECGAGLGTLMADIMRVGSKAPDFTKSVHISLIETQGDMRKKQENMLSSYNISWHEHIVDISEDKPCIIIGNEFLDALPIEQLKRSDDGWVQKFVTFSDNSFKFEWQKADESLLELLPNKTQSNQIYEISKERISFINDCSSLIEKNGGAALFIDYGHIKSHYGDTLQAVKTHKYSDILKDIGQSDITSHIDFDALKRSILDNVAVAPIITQRSFLLNLGIEVRARALMAANPEKAGDIKGQVDRLISKDHMGDLFKVMCFYNGDIHPCGFI